MRKSILFLPIVVFMAANVICANTIVQRHVIKKGETLSSVAQRYNTTIEQLRKWNNLNSNRIYPGQTIIVNKYEAIQKPVDSHYYIVKKGDTLSSISKTTGISVEKLKAYNNMKTNAIMPGQKLVLVQQEKTQKSHTEIQKKDNISEANAYFVKKGDTLSSISKKTGISIDELKKLNNLKSSKLALGQKIILKTEEKLTDSDTQQVIAITESKTQQVANENAPATPQATTISINKYHTVKKGETLSKIASKYRTTVASIKRLNGLKTNTIKPGKTLIVARIVKEIPAPVINPTPIAPVSPKVYYRVKLGDTLESIAEKFGISVSALRETNLLTDGKIKIGQTLVIPEMASYKEATEKETSLSSQEKIENTGSNLLASRIIENALNFINTPYRYGGLSKTGIDCSGLAKKSYEAAGLSLPRTSREQAKTGEVIPVSALKPGDLIFFGYKGRINHVGIYIGDNKFIHASRESGKVVVANLEDSYYQKHLICARTLVNGEQAYWLEQESN
ncbi:MAG TPA: LysM peptidoglycan-binding domain-containing protein [bacterium]|nr:LysM peptidoglycan-binding domain-containing protein [bacterium]HOL49029.1 LysM peptidoglycan-binding domain-containing protein [bacterium]